MDAGIEFMPATLYFFFLFFVPQSPRWLILKGKTDEALAIMKKLEMKKLPKKSLRN